MANELGAEDLFAGAGGLSEGLRDPGFRIVLAIRQKHKPDNRKNARSTTLIADELYLSGGLFYVEICSFKRAEYFRIKNREDFEHRAT
jgi:hypothetical protein